MSREPRVVCRLGGEVSVAVPGPNTEALRLSSLCPPSFPHHETPCQDEASDGHTVMPALYGHAVWFDGDLPWDAKAAFGDPNCSFAIVQSSSGVDVGGLAGQVAEELAVTQHESKGWFPLR